jgi:hypothetical protein
MADTTTQAAYLAEILRGYGLESLNDWARNAIIFDWSQEQFVLELYKRPEFRSRFAGMFALEAAGRPPVSVDEYLAYEKTAHSTAAMWGVTLSKEEVDNLIAGEVSNIELGARFDLAAEAMFNSDDETISELLRMNPNVNGGDLIRYYMNPKEELGKLQTSFRQAQIAGAAVRTGWGQLSLEQAQRLQEVGLTREQSQTGFAELARMDQVMNPFSITEDIITEEEQVQFLAGDVEAAARIEGRTRARLAEFAGTGGFAQGQQGFAVGSANQ